MKCKYFELILLRCFQVKRRGVTSKTDENTALYKYLKKDIVAPNFVFIAKIEIQRFAYRYSYLQLEWALKICVSLKAVPEPHFEKL